VSSKKKSKSLVLTPRSLTNNTESMREKHNDYIISFAVAHWDAPLRCAPLTQVVIRYESMDTYCFSFSLYDLNWLY
jgi:hypothetical protein